MGPNDAELSGPADFLKHILDECSLGRLPTSLEEALWQSEAAQLIDYLTTGCWAHTPSA